MTELVPTSIRAAYDEAGIEGLVQGLFSLIDGELSMAALVGVGEPSIPVLRRVLLEGKTSTVYLPRQRIVRVLGELRAFSALSDYLLRDKSIQDPELRLAEEAVENTAARELGRSQSDGAFYLLRAVAATRKLPGAVESLAGFRRDAAAPVLVAALESDFCRNAAADGVRLIRAGSIPYLIEKVRSPEPSRAEETPSSLRHRRAALVLLAEDELEVKHWGALEFLLYETDEWLQSCTAKIAFRLSKSEFAFRILIGHLGSHDWVLVYDIAQFLREHLADVRELVAEELGTADAAATPEQAKRCRLLRWVTGSETLRNTND